VVECLTHTVVIFDEAHNLDSICCDSLSVSVSLSVLQRVVKYLCILSACDLGRMREKEREREENEWAFCKQGIVKTERDGIGKRTKGAREIMREKLQREKREKLEHILKREAERVMCFVDPIVCFLLDVQSAYSTQRESLSLSSAPYSIRNKQMNLVEYGGLGRDIERGVSFSLSEKCYRNRERERERGRERGG